jgi:hypothetical protein
MPENVPNFLWSILTSIQSCFTDIKVINVTQMGRHLTAVKACQPFENHYFNLCCHSLVCYFYIYYYQFSCWILLMSLRQNISADKIFWNPWTRVFFNYIHSDRWLVVLQDDCKLSLPISACSFIYLWTVNAFYQNIRNELYMHSIKISLIP